MLPIIAITMGDPAGIGPELVLKVLSDRAYSTHCTPFIIGDPEVFQEMNHQLRTDIKINVITSLSEAKYDPLKPDLLRPDNLDLPQVTWGELNPVYGKAAAVCLQEAWKLAGQGKIHGIVSAPMNKQAFHDAGYNYLDELAYFAEITGCQDAFFMGVMGKVWTVAVAEHVAFADILPLIKKDRILWYISHMHDVLYRILGIEPRLAVAGLNPHSGEGGLLGKEEILEIQPAIKEAWELGFNVNGPVPADIVFPQALSGAFDGVVCMYHDHANTARKLQPTHNSATLYMGLPVIGATTAHGTAFDIAGKGTADPGSMSAAMAYAIKLSGST
ncbi:MAG: 4-hydroxythreonine-4-phosphate dehydrogenase PdxA [Anaerolineae bacterium]|nr:4-hydroxythreonine-4-phosphate dehydrogenase PdxA [Anaerolineae bacterium]